MLSETRTPNKTGREAAFDPSAKDCPNRFCEKVAGATGLEPAASCVTGKRSNQLSYAPA